MDGVDSSILARVVSYDLSGSIASNFDFRVLVTDWPFKSFELLSFDETILGITNVGAG